MASSRDSAAKRPMVVVPFLLMAFLQCLFHVTNATELKMKESNLVKRNYDDNHAKVLILGAGAAGLQAAKYLHDKEMDDFIVIEGADYIGGRVHNVPFAGVKVELGANWAQPGGTTVVQQVKDLDLETHLSDWESMVMINDTGNDVTDESDPSWERLEAAIEKAAEIAQDIVDNDKPDMSQRAALRLGGWVPKTPIDRAVEWFDYDFEWADIPDVTSLQSTALLDDSEDVLFVTDQRGFLYIFNNIVGFMQEDPYLNHIRLNQTVMSIDHSDDDGVTVTCQDGTVYTGDYALVTFGLGVMQERLVEFNPPLPNWKIEEFSQFLMTSFTKIFVKWPSKFWDDEEWIVHVNERRGYYPVFLNMEAEGLFPNGTNILAAFVSGDEARRIEDQSDAETKAEIEQVLRSMYGTQAVPEAEDILISGWNRNPLHRGAYSNWPVEVSLEDFEKMQANVGRLFFGGEHTDEIYNGYILGAQLSGEREAEKLLQCLDGKCPAPTYPGSTASTLFISTFFMSILTVFATLETCM
ncbi:uncharacterized protein [Amphiura filiformis]|uniref:uncharacterized protein n=1 Tax=Amphiura filiformis TaxID=82378 RepID=UPI003B2148B3